MGCAAAVLIPDAGSASLDTPMLAPRDPLQRAAMTKAERGPVTDGSVYLRARPGTVSIEHRRRDPAGGPEWAIRAFEADRMIPPAARRPHTDGVISVALCAQLGRIVDGEFGWIDGTNHFRRVTTAAFEGLPALCTSRLLGARHHPEIASATLVDRPRGGDPLVRGTVVWGLTGSGGRRATIDGAGSRRAVRPTGRHGAYLTFAGAKTDAASASVTVAYADGARGVAPRRRLAPAGIRIPRSEPIDPASATVTARAPDPAGGPSWGLPAVRSRSGQWCIGQAGTLVGDRVGEIDVRLGVLREQRASDNPYGCGARARPTPERPLVLASAAGTALDRLELAPQRSALRRSPGRQVTYGIAHASVRSVTVIGNGGVRTVVPSGPAHAFLVVEDGGYVGGSTTVIAHLADGSTFRQTI